MKSLRELMDLQGRVTVITGGAGHIGLAMGEALAELGAHIVVLDSQEDSCTKACASLERKFGAQTLPIVIDLIDEKAIRSVPEAVIKRFGRIDILINCAALVGTSTLQGWTTTFLEQKTDTWTKALEVNLTAPFVLIQACTPALIESGHGSVINIGSTYGVVGPDLSLYEGTPMGNPAAYAASKGGLIQLTRWLATNLAPKVRVNAISPGGVFRNQPQTFVERYIQKTPLKRMATEEDFKGMAAYLASDLSLYVTGQNFMVDGGWTIW